MEFIGDIRMEIDSILIISSFLPHVYFSAYSGLLFIHQATFFPLVYFSGHPSYCLATLFATYTQNY